LASGTQITVSATSEHSDGSYVTRLHVYKYDINYPLTCTKSTTEPTCGIK